MNSTFTSLEFPDVNALNVLIDNWDNLPLTQEHKKPIKIQDNEYQLLPLLKKYKKSITGDFTTIKYGYSKNHLISGRQFAKDISLQGMKRWVRHTLSKGYYDYDIVNCHPTIFLQYCQKKKWNTTAFERYNQNRDAYLLELMTTNNLTRDDAKEVVLSLLNGGTKNFNALDFKPEWLILYHNALTETHKKFLNDPENDELIKHIKTYKERNIGGSVMNHILCNIENDVLTKAKNYLNVKNPILIFDGFQSKEFFNTEALEQLQKYILQETGYDLKWIEKPMNEGIDLSAFSAKVQVDEALEKYNILKEKFEKTIARINEPCQYIVEKENGEIYICKRTELVERYTDWGLCGKTEFIHLWLRDPNKRFYESIVFYPPPLVCPENCYNLWKGFEIEKETDDSVQEKDLGLFMDLALSLVGDNEIYLDYFLNYYAQLIQQPGKSCEICILLAGQEGVGKDFFFDLMKKIIGKKYVFTSTDPEDEIFCRFKGNLQNKLLIILNEAEPVITAKYEQQLKDLITKKEINIELKGKEPFTINHYGRVNSASNDTWGKPISITNTDRRFVVYNPSNRHLCNHDGFFTELGKWLDEPKNVKGIFNYFKNKEITIKNWITERPKTEIYENIKRLCLPVEVKFLEYIVDNWNKDFAKLSNENIHSIIEKTLRVNNYDMRSFNSKIKKLKFESLESYRSNCSRGWLFDKDKLIKDLELKFDYKQEQSLFLEDD